MTNTISSEPSAYATTNADRLRVARRVLVRAAMLPALIVVVIVGAVLSPAFLTADNILNILQQSSELAVVVVAETLILIAGKFDLSLESVVGLAPMTGAWLVAAASLGGSGWRVNPLLALLVTLGIGALIGFVNGFLVVRLGLNAFITTLAMLILLRGLTLGVSGGQTLSGLPDTFIFLGNATLVGIPVSIILAAVIFLAGGLFLRYSTTGRQLYVIGGNSEAARAAGVNVDRVLHGVFIAAGTLSAVAGLMLTGRVASVSPAQGQNLIFTVFAAAVIGGISLDGGRGTMFGALTGVLLLGVIQNVLTLAQVPSFWIDASFGAIILFALLVTRITSGKDDS